MIDGDTYKTISSRAEGLYKDKGSKFIAIALPVSSEGEVKLGLSEIRSEYHDARHHCYAYMLGPDRLDFRFNDDGEPSGTAGRPILGQINSNDLTNILVVVVRYFGGTKLGVRGLINAYKSSTSEALKSTKFLNKTVDNIYKVKFEYPMMNHVMRIVKDEKLTVVSQNFGLSCELCFQVRKSKAKVVLGKFSEFNQVNVSYLNTV